MSIAIADDDHVHVSDFGHIIQPVRDSFHLALERGGPLFTTDVTGLWDAYLTSFPVAERQHHNCNCCRRFIERFGGLVTISEDGQTVPAMWATGDENGYRVAPEYLAAWSSLWARVQNARVTGVFLTSERTWGTPYSFDVKRGKEWSHLAVEAPLALLHRDRVRTPSQAMAAKREDFLNVTRALADFKPTVLDEALRIFDADAVSRSDKFRAPLKWLRDLQDRPKGRRGENLVWRAVTAAPEGFCHPRSAVTGTLLEDIAAGMSFDQVKRRFEAKVGPLAYQRPQAVPSAGNIKAAEALFEKLGLAPSLERRFARLDELPEEIWSPKPLAEENQSGGVFGHLKAKDAESVNKMVLPARTMTWEKFARDVLPTAEEIKALLGTHAPFYAITTAEHPDAPPILKWDQDDARNPFAWYTRPGIGGMRTADWCLGPGGPVKVTAVTPFPCNFGGPKDYFPWQGVILLLEGCKDRHTSSNALFPECLKGELRQVRSTIEAYSKSAKLGGNEEASACGIGMHPKVAEVTLRVRVGGAWSDYRIDRWD